MLHPSLFLGEKIYEPRKAHGHECQYDNVILTLYKRHQLQYDW